jgi:hypothetical protein
MRATSRNFFSSSPLHKNRKKKRKKNDPKRKFISSCLTVYSEHLSSYCHAAFPRCF